MHISCAPQGIHRIYSFGFIYFHFFVPTEGNTDTVYVESGGPLGWGTQENTHAIKSAQVSEDDF